MPPKKRKSVEVKTEPNVNGNGSNPKKWREAFKQDIQSSEYKVIDANKYDPENPNQIQFELTSDRVWSFGPNTRFEIQGSFQKLLDAATEWVPMEEADVAKVQVMPNFLEACFKQLDVFHGDLRLTYNDGNQYITPFLNAFLYNYMDKDQKKMLMIRDYDTGHAVPSDLNGWDFAGADWAKIGPLLFAGKAIDIDYVPLHVPPFFQHANYFEPGKEQICLPMPIMNTLTVRFTMHEHQANIFKKKVLADKTKYRFRFDLFQLHVEVLRLNPRFQEAFLKQLKPIEYPGVTRIMRHETVTNKAQVFDHKIQNISFPEGVFIFAVPTGVLSGNWPYQNNTDSNVFSAHNIASLSFTYGKNVYFYDQPNIGIFKPDIIKKKLFFDYLKTPPFGVKFDPEKIKIDNILGKGTPYPHIYVNFCNSDGSRILPRVIPEKNILAGENNLEVHLVFEPEGAAANVTYIFYYFFTDQNIIFDMKARDFYSPYIKIGTA